MQIDAKWEVAQGLCAYWKLAADREMKRRERYAKTLRTDLASGIVQAVSPYGGQLILTHHEFLSRVPNGSHSFAHGSEMVSRTIYWVTIARLQRFVTLERIKEKKRTVPMGVVGGVVRKMSVVTPTTFYLPVRWEKSLWPIYPSGSSQPSFTLDRPDKKPNILAVDEKRIDISALGDHLFRLTPKGEFDWATRISIIVGTRAVKAWLIDRHSSATYERIRSHAAFR